jgi:hypothetical protein
MPRLAVNADLFLQRDDLGKSALDTLTSLEAGLSCLKTLGYQLLLNYYDIIKLNANHNY